MDTFACRPNDEQCCNADHHSDIDSLYMHIVIVHEFYAKKGPFTKQIATEGFSTVFGQLMSPYNKQKV